MNSERSTVKYPKRFKQSFLFNGLVRHNHISPMDIDMFIDYGGHSFFYGEGKSAGVELTKGQEYAIENIIKSHSKAGHPSIYIVFEHLILNPNSPVIVKDQIVKKIYYTVKNITCKWRYFNRERTVLDLINWWENKEKLKIKK